MTPVNSRRISQSNQGDRHRHQEPQSLQFPGSFHRIRLKKGMLALALASLMLGGGIWFHVGTVQGVPVSIVFKFLTDTKARAAYFSGQPALLHDRLRDMGIEDEIKAFYRDQYTDEAELDWFIHQLLYDRSGYVGKAYKIGPQDQLILKTSKDLAFPRWLVLARKADVVRHTRKENGVQLVMLQNGTYVTYGALSEIYTVKVLRQLIRQQRVKR